jgi:hypothetical protein
MWKAEGFAGFMKGNGINVIRVSRSVVAILTIADSQILPYSALQFTVSELGTDQRASAYASRMALSRTYCRSGRARTRSPHH